MDLGSDPTAFRVMHGYSWPQSPSAAFCVVFSGKEVRFCGLVAQNALSASQTVREMGVMVNCAGINLYLICTRVCFVVIIVLLLPTTTARE